MTTLTLNYEEIITEAEAFISPYDTKTEEELNLMAYNGARVLNQLNALKYAMFADETGAYANKAVRVVSRINAVENMLAVIEDVREERKS